MTIVAIEGLGARFEGFAKFLLIAHFDLHDDGRAIGYCWLASHRLIRRHGLRRHLQCSVTVGFVQRGLYTAGQRNPFSRD